ncbi:MAG: ABC transporter ATP-binding protein [Rhizobiaceae bacterium]|nr:ABC transporter ATP-binding protein [Rhizobiaceae bacterium]
MPAVRIRQRAAGTRPSGPTGSHGEPDLNTGTEFDVEFRAVAKRFGAVTAVEETDFQLPRGSFVALLGPSGCGKTTCLRMIGGFEQPSAGRVLIGGEDMTGVAPYRRPVNMVFQHYALFPHFDVETNIAYGLRQIRPRLGDAEIARRVGEALEMVHLDRFARRRIHEMSGGQQQRVALARAIVNKPRVLLLDEPLAALDKKLRIAMQMELQNLHRDLGITFLLVTHDQEEALSMSDRVCVMNAGRIVQFASPREIYDRPANPFVADFVGKTNSLTAVLTDADGRRATATLANGARLPVVSEGIVNGEVALSIRPEAIRIAAAGGETGGLRGTVTHRIFLGASAEYSIAVPGIGNILVLSGRDAGGPAELHEPGTEVELDIAPEAPRIFSLQT